MRQRLLSFALLGTALCAAAGAHAQSRSEAVEMCKEAVIARGYGENGFDRVEASRVGGGAVTVTGRAVGDRGRADFSCGVQGRRVASLTVDAGRRGRRDWDERRRMRDLATAVHCESENYGRNRCDIDTRGGVRLVEQTSNTRCRRGANWGVDAGSVWVDKGCSARFESAGRRAVTAAAVSPPRTAAPAARSRRTGSPAEATWPRRVAA